MTAAETSIESAESTDRVAGAGRRFEEAPGVKMGVDQPLDASTQLIV